MAVSYPDRPSPVCVARAKNYILAMPYMLPCEGCFEHARAYIEKRQGELDEICGSRDEFFKFTVDMHNMVNRRYNKPEMSVEDARKLYTNAPYKFSYHIA
jgi:hypothetical protein